MNGLDQVAANLPAMQKIKAHAAYQKWLSQSHWTHFITLTFPNGEASKRRAEKKLMDLAEDLERMLYPRNKAGREKSSTIFFVASLEDKHGFNTHLHVLYKVPPSKKMRPGQSIESMCRKTWVTKFRLGQQITVQEINTTEDRLSVVNYTLKQVRYQPDRLILRQA